MTRKLLFKFSLPVTFGQSYSMGSDVVREKYLGYSPVLPGDLLFTCPRGTKQLSPPAHDNFV